jgi:hypothetical protein
VNSLRDGFRNAEGLIDAGASPRIMNHDHAWLVREQASGEVLGDIPQGSEIGDGKVPLEVGIVRIVLCEAHRISSTITEKDRLGVDASSLSIDRMRPGELWGGSGGLKPSVWFSRDCGNKLWKF